MKRFIESHGSSLSVDNFLLSDYSEETKWEALKSYFRRTVDGYTCKYKTNTTDEDPTFIEKDLKFNHNIPKSEMELFSKYSAIVKNEKAIGIPESTDSNTIITNDGIIVVFLSGSFIIYDLFARDGTNDQTDFGSDYSRIFDTYNVKSGQTFENTIGTSLKFIGDKVGESIVFYKNVLYKKNGRCFYQTNCRFKSDKRVTLEGDGFFSEPVDDLFSQYFESIHLPMRQSYIVKDLTNNIEEITVKSSRATYIVEKVGANYNITIGPVYFTDNNLLSNDYVELEVKSDSDKVFFEVL